MTDYDPESYYLHRRGLAAALRSIGRSLDLPEGSVAHEAIAEGAKVLAGEPVETAANHVCAAVPEGYVVNLSMENGAAWVELWRVEDEHGAVEITLPDAAAKSLWTQLFEAVETAVQDEAERTP